MYFGGRGKFGHRQHTWRVSHENGGRDWRSAPTSQGIPVIASKPPEARKEGQNGLSLTADGRNQLYDTRILRLLSSYIQTIYFCCLSHLVCGTVKETSLTCMLSHLVMSNSVRPYGLQAPRFICPWDSPDNNGSGLLCPLPGTLPNLGIKPEFLVSLAMAGGFFTTSATWEAQEHQSQEEAFSTWF